jgi:hypothetical protein
LLKAAVYLLHFLAFHGATDVNHKNQVLVHVCQVLGGEEVGEVVIGHLKQRRASKASFLSTPYLDSGAWARSFRLTKRSQTLSRLTS